VCGIEIPKKSLFSNRYRTERISAEKLIYFPYQGFSEIKESSINRKEKVASNIVVSTEKSRK